MVCFRPAARIFKGLHRLAPRPLHLVLFATRKRWMLVGLCRGTPSTMSYAYNRYKAHTHTSYAHTASTLAAAVRRIAPTGPTHIKSAGALSLFSVHDNIGPAIRMLCIHRRMRRSETLVAEAPFLSSWFKFSVMSVWNCCSLLRVACNGRCSLLQSCSCAPMIS